MLPGDQRTHPRQATSRQPDVWTAMETNASPKPVRSRAHSATYGVNRSGPRTAEGVCEFGRFRVLSRQRQLLADGVPVELGTRAFDLLLVLLEAGGSLVSKEQLLSGVWQGIVVSEENLKVQVAALRKALGADRDLIRTEFGRGYRFTGALRSNSAPDRGERAAWPRFRPGPAFLPRTCWRSLRCRFSSAVDLSG
jgi:DNA-binding winged helix-turn-helix (wHTH) protein